MSKHSWIGLVAALALGSAACPGGGGAWELDGAFGEAGRVTTALGGADDEARALTVLADRAWGASRTGSFITTGPSRSGWTTRSRG